MGKLKVLIVDDEKPAREMLSYTINWDNTAFEICDYAFNGKDAIDKYYKYKPDLIITDIEMPLINGLELIKIIRKNDSRQKFIILSCYEKFSYAREAIRMNVVDYLIKDLITPQDLYSTLLKVQKEIQNDMEYEEEKKYFNDNQESIFTLGNMTLKTIIFDKTSIDHKYIKACNKFFSDTYFVILSLHLDDYKNNINKKSYNDQERIKRLVHKSIRKALGEGLGGEASYYENGEFIILAKIKKSSSQYEIMTESSQIAFQIQKTLQNYDRQLSGTIGISEGFKGLNDLFERYKEASDIIKYRLFLGKGKILFYNMALPKLTSMNYEVLEKSIDRIKKALEENDEIIIRNEILNLYCINLNGFIQYNYIREINGQLYDLILNLCSTYSIKYYDLYGYNYIPIQEIDTYDTIKEISDWFTSVFISILQRKDCHKKYSRHVKDAIEFIESNYEKKVSLNEIAEALNLHKVYLSRLFKEETGETITNYIANFRIEKAKKIILSTNLKFYEIAESIGYLSTQQFYVAFKRHTGMTPKEFRDKIF